MRGPGAWSAPKIFKWEKTTERLVAERVEDRVYREGHPSHASGPVKVACRVTKEVYVKNGRTVTWWVRSGIFEGCAYEGGCRFPSKRAAMAAFAQ